jgi:CelD/BcsL family acetyltransferase involved in cellulose biosynthesis
MEMVNKIHTNQFSTRLLKSLDLTDKDISDWKYLESRAVEANAFLSPNFVIPAIRYLENNSKVNILTIYKKSPGSPELVGVFVFKLCNFSKLSPFPHISAFHSRHSFLSGILADQLYAPEVVKLIFQYLFNSYRQSHLIVFEEHPAEGPMSEIVKNVASQLGMVWLPFSQWDRSILYPSQLDEEGTKHLSKRLLKNFKYYMRGLSEQGNVNWEIIQRNQISPANIDTFLRLENMGWKGKAHTSLYSQPNHLIFFRKMIQNFSEDGRAFFTELRLNDMVIASTSNLIAGNAGFAFKIGWDESYAKYSPSTLNEIMLLKCKETSFKQLKYIDSGTSEDSYINRIWPGKAQINTGFFYNSNTNKLIPLAMRYVWYPVLSYAKKIKQRLLRT